MAPSASGTDRPPGPGSDEGRDRRPEGDPAEDEVQGAASAEAFPLRALDFPKVRALFERLAVTSLGRRALRELEPRSDEGARAALERAREMQVLARAGALPSLAGVSDVVPAIEAARRFRRPLAKDELAAVRSFLDARARLAPWFAEQRERAPVLAALAGVASELASLRELLANALDERGELQDGASPRLARLRRESSVLERRLAELVAGVAARAAVRAVLSDGGVHRRGGRAVLAVRAKSSGRVPGIVHDRSQSGETVFVEPREAVEPGNRLAGLVLEARAEESRLLVELSREVLAASDALARAAHGLAELELALVSSAFCREFGARVPRVESHAGAELVLRGARHPLLVDAQRRGLLAEVVPIDVRLGGDFDLLVITGPNTGGKTLALKTAGVAAACARLGLPVCCGEGSSVPLYEALVVDIGDEQEISQNLSTFASHLGRIRAGLERAGGRTLVLLDELGGGTDPDEGAALGDAILEFLLERGVPTLATTHLGKLKEFCFRHARAENASVEFDAATLAPRFRLLVGTPGESNAIAVAQRLGLAPEIVARARERLERRDRDVLELMDDMRGAREHAEHLRSAAEARLEDLAETQGHVERERAELERRGALLEAEAQRGLEERVSEARRRLALARSWIAQLASEPAGRLRAELEATDRALAGASLTERRRAFLEGLGKGQFVYLARYRKRCLVTKVDRAREELSVRLGKLDVKVGFDEVTWYESL